MNTSTFFNALKWSVAAEFASKAVQPLVFVILARLLNPEDYGVAAGAIMVISFTQIFWEAGMSKAIIQKKTDIDNAATVAFWINVTIAVIISIIIFLFSEIIADVIFHDLIHDPFRPPTRFPAIIQRDRTQDIASHVLFQLPRCANFMFYPIAIERVL